MNRRNELDRARRAAETDEQKKERLEKRREQRKSARAAETDEQKMERLKKRRERETAWRREQKKVVRSEERMQQAVSNVGSPCQLEYQNSVIPCKRKGSHNDQKATSSEFLQQKHQRLAAETDDTRESRLEQLRVYHSEMMEVETQGEREARLEHVSHLEQLKLPMEADEERDARLKRMSHLKKIDVFLGDR